MSLMKEWHWRECLLWTEVVHLWTSTSFTFHQLRQRRRSYELFWGIVNHFLFVGHDDCIDLPGYICLCLSIHKNEYCWFFVSFSFFLKLTKQHILTGEEIENQHEWDIISLLSLIISTTRMNCSEEILERKELDESELVEWPSTFNSL